MKSNRDKKPNLTHAKDNFGLFVHINNATDNQNYTCPICGNQVFPHNKKKEGRKRAPSFMHKAGSDCVGNGESVLHKLAKDILQEEKKIMLPPLNDHLMGTFICTNVVSETNDEGTGLRPDCICFSGEDELWVEFKRSHEVDSKKAEKIQKARKNCIELDLNVFNDQNFNKEKFREFIVNCHEHRIWVYNNDLNITKKFHGQRIATDYHESNEAFTMDFAFDRDGRIINSDSNRDEISSTGDYYCLSCGEKLRVTQNGRFLHSGKGCGHQTYLSNSAVQILYNRLSNSSNSTSTSPVPIIAQGCKTAPFMMKNTV